MEKQQSKEGLFDTINVDDIEENLITVDQTTEELAKVQEEIESDVTKGDEGTPAGAGESTKKPGETETKPGEKEKPETTEKKVDVIEVDKTIAAGKGEKEKTDKGVGGTRKDSKESSVHLHAASLQDKGVLPNFKLDNIKDLEPAEALDKIDKHIAGEITASIKAGVDQYKQSLSPQAQEFLEALDTGVPYEVIRDITTMKDRYGSIAEKDLKDNEPLQKEIYSESLRMKGITEGKIEKFVEKATQDNELFDESKDGLADINTTIATEESNAVTKAKDEKVAIEARNQKTKENIASAVKEVKEIFPGITITPAEKTKIEQMMTTPVSYQSRNGREIPISAAMALRAKDPIAFEMKLNYFINNGFFDGNKDLNKFAKKSVTVAANKLVDSFSSTEHKSGSPTVKKTETEEEKDKKDEFIYPDIM